MIENKFYFGEWVSITGDSTYNEYQLLQDISLKLEVKGLICEIGVLGGYGLYTLMESLGPQWTYIGVYTLPDNSMKRKTKRNLFIHCCERDIELLFFDMDDTEYFERFPDGVPIYRDGKKTFEEKYAIVYLDGPRDQQSLEKEINFFHNKIPNGGFIIIDGICTLPFFDYIDSLIQGLSFHRYAITNKNIGYKKGKK